MGVIWAKTARVGCAYQMCGPGFISDTYPYQSNLVCQYDPPGNYVGQYPYSKAASNIDVASECPGDYVSDKKAGLCIMSSTSSSPTTAPTSESVDCEGFPKKQCKKKTACAFGATELVSCTPKEMYKHDCSQYSSKKKCNKKNVCKYSKGKNMCMHKCDQVTKKKCMKAREKKSKNKVCAYAAI